MTGLILIFLATLIINFNFLVFQSVGGKLLGCEIEEIGFFTGHAIFKFEIGGIVFRLNAIPFGGFVKFADSFEKKSAIIKILVLLVGNLSYLFLAVVGIGVSETFRHSINGFGQIFQGVISPFAVGTVLIEAVINVFRSQSFIAGTGILACKMFAFNMLPLGNLSGGILIINLLELIGFKSEKFREKYSLVGLLIALIIMLVWLVALIAFVLKSF